jgi:iron(III) transport system permease protein
LEQIHSSLEEAARVSGATWLQNFRDIVVPLIKPGLVASFLLVFMPTLRELTISILLAGPKTTTIGVAVYNLQEEGLYQISAALAGLIIGILFIGNYFVRKVINIKTIK